MEIVLPRWAHYRNGCVKIGMGVIVRLAWGGGSVALAGLIYVFPIQYTLSFDALARACPQAGAYRVSDYSYLCKDLILGML